MSKKPLKKSDAGKEWRKTRQDRKPRLISPEYHLIVTEGTKTEPNYFEGLRKEINDKYPNRLSIAIEGIGQGANTLTLLDKAEEIYSEYNRKYNLEFKHVWIVFDKDDFKEDSFDNTVKRCQELSKKSKRNNGVKFHALWSNECIEYWFLLHFSYLTSAIHRSEYIPKLTECLGTKYEKNRDDIYALLRPHLLLAIENAKSIMKSYNDTPPSKCTPGTKVYEIFDILSPYLE